MADINISTAQEFVDLMQGNYGYGSDDDYLEVTVTADIDMNDLGDPYNFPNPAQQTWYINLDGNGHKISNIYHAGTSTSDFLFFYQFNGSIKNLTIKDIFVTARHVYLFYTNRAGDSIENVRVSGNIQASGNNVSVFRITTNGLMHRCSVSGSYSAAYTVSLFEGGTAVGCNVVATRIGNRRANIYNCVATSCSAIIDNMFTTDTTNIYIPNNNSGYSYAVVKASNTAVCAMGNGASILYDTDVGTAGGVTFSGGNPETTEHLQDPDYMAEVWGYPT